MFWLFSVRDIMHGLCCVCEELPERGNHDTVGYLDFLR